MIVQAPERSAPASRHADWLELLALTSGEVGLGELRAILKIEDDPNRHRFDRDLAEVVEEEILQTSDSDLVRACVEELERRANLLDVAYPFSLHEDVSGSRKNVTLQIRLNGEHAESRYIYLLCLILSAIRLEVLALEPEDRLLKVDNRKLFSEHRFGHLLQIAASVALGGYILGDVVSFGFPRPNKTRFLTAHAQAWQKFGAYDPVRKTPQALQPNTKDGGIDLIAWVHFPDLLASKTLVFGQVASGLDWTGKPVHPYVERLKHWFRAPAFTHWYGALVVPFNITDAGTFIQRQGPLSLRAACFIVEESVFGIVFDRDRVVNSVNRYFTIGQALPIGVDRADAIDEIRDWVKMVVDRI